jgi:hypothetical protein
MSLHYVDDGSSVTTMCSIPLKDVHYLRGPEFSNTSLDLGLAKSGQVTYILPIALPKTSMCVANAIDFI